MEIIGEKINGTRKRIARAIAERDAAQIQDLAVKQNQAGAAWLDVNTGSSPEQEPDDLCWLVETIQEVVDCPLCLDSANPAALRAAIEVTNKAPLINSISGESERLSTILPLAAKHGCSVIALAMDATRIPETVDERMKVIRKIIGASRAAGVPDSRVYLDPLSTTLATNTNSAKITLATIHAIREAYPDAHLTMGLSNISSGLPARSHIHRAFLTLAVAAGLDSAIMDPLDRKTMAALLATELVLGYDPYCLTYIRSYRSGVLGP